MQKFHRGERRFQRHRLFKKRFKDEWAYVYDKEHTSKSDIARYAKTRVTTAKRCSCWMCRNARRNYGNSFYGRTFQEIRFMARLNDE